MCNEDAITLEDGTINQDTHKLGEEFNVFLRVSPNEFNLKIINLNLFLDQSTC